MSQRHQLSDVKVADSYRSRVVGLMGRRDLSSMLLWIPRCSSIHTCFMRGPIDVAFLNESRQVVSTHKAVKPWRMLVGSGSGVLEAPAGFLEMRGVAVGDIVEW
ncbi:MAG TPA: DUF192 domain-containing protein [Thermoanaerobaculia bacterium]|nr:DUF192 domain-containing protein [Thermoanaerobaculia bacterium]